MPQLHNQLSNEQQVVFNKIVLEKKNIFFTGCAGTGKTFLLKSIVQHYLTTFDEPESLAVTASTGRAAFNIGGVTLHSFAGLGLAKENIDDLLSKATFNKKVSQRWRNVKVLIIDEISMLDAEFFDKLSTISKSIRKSRKPFGGIQLILTGDLLQLPPVSEGSNYKKRIFEADCWVESINEYIVLWEVFRQSDYEFTKVLTCIRLGAVNDEIVEFINNLATEKKYDSDTGPVNLYSTRAKADKFNNENLNSINSDLHTYTAIDRYKSRSKYTPTTLESCPAVSDLRLKVGAQVMLVKNLNKDLVNGTVGVLLRFTETPSDTSSVRHGLPTESLPIVRFDLADGRVFTRPIAREIWSQTLPTGEEIASRRQIPLILAWAVTIHKSQGQTIQRLKVDLSDIFESGQVYTALSRAVSPETLQVTGFNPDKLIVDTEAFNFCMKNDLI